MSAHLEVQEKSTCSLAQEKVTDENKQTITAFHSRVATEVPT